MTAKEWTELAGSGVQKQVKEGKLKAPGFYSQIPSPGVSPSFGVLLNQPQSHQGTRAQDSVASPPSFTCSSVLSRFVPDGESSLLAFPNSAFSDFTIGSVKLTVVAYLSKCYKSGTPPTQGLLNIYQHLPVTG